MRSFILLSGALCMLFFSCQKQADVKSTTSGSNMSGKTVVPGQMPNNSKLEFFAMQHPSLRKGGAAVGTDGFSEADWINDAGVIAGASCVNGCESYEAFGYAHGLFTPYGTFGGYASVAYGINNRGDLVGQSDTEVPDEFGGFISVAFLTRNGVVSKLGELPGYSYSAAFAINNSGKTVGRCYNADPEDPASPMRAVLFEGNGKVTDIGTLGGTTSLAFGINDLNEIVGRAKTASGEQHAFVYKNRIMSDIGTLGGNYSTGRAINNAGTIVGGSRYSSSKDQHAFVYANGVMTDLGTFGGSFSEAFSISESGWIAGYARTASGEDHAFIYRNGRMEDLQTLGGTFSVATGVNNKGEVVGISETADGYVHGFYFNGKKMIDIGVLQ